MYYKEIEPENNTFSTLVVDITHRCNMRCSNCYIPNRVVPDMDKNKLFEFLGKLPKRTHIRLIGAEPTMREDLIDIIKTIKLLGHKMSLITNGLKLSKYEYCRKLKEAGLNIVHISMNGGNSDDIYNIMDNGKYAKLKITALENALKCNYITSISSIIAKDVNESTIKNLVETLLSVAEKNNINFNNKPWNRLKPVVRFRSVGQIGNYISNHSYSTNELLELVCSQLNLDKLQAFKSACGIGHIYKETNINDNYSWIIKYESKIGEIYIKMTSWQIDSDGIVDPKNENRGRITQNWKIAPFFEHIKLNEFGY